MPKKNYLKWGKKEQAYFYIRKNCTYFHSVGVAQGFPDINWLEGFPSGQGSIMIGWKSAQKVCGCLGL